MVGWTWNAKLATPDLAHWSRPAGDEHYHDDGRLRKKFYEGELKRMQEELVQLQYWVQRQGLRVLVIFEGRGSAGKGGVIKRINERTSPRIVRTEALPKPTERESTQWYFQRYVPLLPSGGEIVLFDRSWYNRSNVEWVMGFCTEKQHAEFLRTCPEFERMLVRSGIILLKYWFSVSYEEQERRFKARNEEPLEALEALGHGPRGAPALRPLFDGQGHDVPVHRHQTGAMVRGAVRCKRRARLNCIGHILNSIPYEKSATGPVTIPEQEDVPYIRPPLIEQTFVDGCTERPSSRHGLRRRDRRSTIRR